MSITSKTIHGVGDSGCLEHASLEVQGEPGYSRRYMFSFLAQQPFTVEQDEDIVNIIITGDLEFGDFIQFINEASKL